MVFYVHITSASSLSDTFSATLVILAISKSIHIHINICITIDYEKNKCPHVPINEGGNLAASKIRNLECPSYEICLIDYGCGKFNRKIHIMEQYP